MEQKIKIGKRNLPHIFFIIGCTLYAFAYIGAIMAPALTYIGALQISRRWFLVSILMTFPATICLYLGKEKISKHLAFQAKCAYFIFLLIFVPLFVRNIISGYPRYYFFVWVECAALLWGTLFWLYISSDSQKGVKKCWNWAKENWFILAVCLLVILVSLEQITKNLRWDSIHYYAYIQRIKRFTFSPNDITMLKASGHASYAYVLIYSIGESIFPGFGYGVRIENMILFSIAIILLHELLKILFPKVTKAKRYFIVVLFAVTPVILGTMHNIDVEILTLTLMIAIFYCCFKEYFVLGSVLGTFLLFTKETCAFLLAGFVIGEAIQIIVKSIKAHKLTTIFSYTTWKEMISLYLPFLFFLEYFCLDVTWGSAKVAKNVDKFNQWGFDSTVVINKVKQLYFMNFEWLTTFLIVLGILYFLYSRVLVKKGGNKSENKILLISVCCTYGMFLFTQLFYITYPFPRYIMLQYFFSSIFLLWAIGQWNIQKKEIRIAATVWSLLVFLNNFMSIDIVSNNMFGTLPIGNAHIMKNSPVAYLDNTTVLTGKAAEFLTFSPYADFNRQWSYFDELINQFLRKIEYNSDTLIIYPDDFAPRSENIYFGMWRNTYYDTQKKCLTQLVSPELYNPDTMVYYNAEIISDDLKWGNFKEVYYIKFEFSTEESDTFISKHIVINDFKITYRGWSLHAYKIKGW